MIRAILEMGTSSLWLTLLVLCHALEAYDPEALFDSLHRSETSRLRYQEKMVRLNKIQSRILNVKLPPFDSNSVTDGIWEGENGPNPEINPYLFEGDIVLTDDQLDGIIQNAEDQLKAKDGASRARRALTSTLALRWKQMPIQYFINTATGVNANAIQAGIDKWQEQTCITFQKVYQRPSIGLEFIYGQGCYSYVGSVGVPQQVSIGYGCTQLGTVTHEIGHALGFFHEQARFDRDDYVNVLTQNIQPQYLNQFTKQSQWSMVDYGIKYDYGSVMHYDRLSFTANGGNTIQTLDANYQNTIGQRIAPSFSDVKMVNFAYCNSTCTSQLACQNGGYTDPKDCSVCRCPDGFGGVLCHLAATNPSQCGSGDLSTTDQQQKLSIYGAVTCSFVITAPAGKKVFFQLTESYFASSNPCQSSYLEVKYYEDLSLTGARYCNSYPTISLSEGNKLVVIYKGTAYSRFSLVYRHDPVTPVTSTTAATTTTTTTTVRPTTTTRTTTTTQRTTTRLMPSTFFPGSNTTPSTSQCGPWSLCSGLCGGCGTTTRRCGWTSQTTVCNLQACPGNGCCQPFTAVLNGQCIQGYFAQRDSPRAVDVSKKYRSPVTLLT